MPLRSRPLSSTVSAISPSCWRSFAIYLKVDSVRFDDIFAAAPALAEMQITFLWRDWVATEVIAFLLFLGAMGKSAQLFLHTWLPDAMEGPTPVSALIHAATMVTAGVFLVCRMSPIMEFAPSATTFVVFVGGIHRVLCCDRGSGAERH